MQRTALILIILSLFFPLLQAQTSFEEATREAEVQPQWPGCEGDTSSCSRMKLLEFINMHLQTPAEAKAAGAGGVVLVEFVIEKNGKIGLVRTLHDPGYGLGTEAVRVVSMMKEKKIKWSPAREDGKKVPFRSMIPVSFNVDTKVKATPPVEVKEVPAPEVYDVVEVMPVYAGCENWDVDTVDCTFMNILKHIQSNLVYPDSAGKAGVQGPVVVEFVIDPTGKVTQAKVTDGIGYGCNEEALRVISMMPAWVPGRQDDLPVPVRMVIPIMFQPSKSPKE